MYLTDKFTMMHIPKTGGTWVKEVLNGVYPGISLGHRYDLIDTKLPVFCFVRNPWDWHLSIYHFKAPNSLKIVVGAELPFDDFIRLVSITAKEAKAEAFRKYANQLLGSESSGLLPILSTWARNELSFYETYIQLFTQHATRIGTTENLRTDIAGMLDFVGVLTPGIETKIIGVPSSNVGQYQNGQQYTEESWETVRRANQDMLKKFYPDLK